MTAARHTYVIAEAGVNHNGSLALALEMVDAAAAAGADAVKFQTFRAEALATAQAQKARYQKETTAPAESQQDMLRRLELSEADHEALVQRCALRGIEFLSSPFDIPSIDMLVGLGIQRVKVPSGELTNLPYLRAIAQTSLPVILSTGMADLGEIQAALAVFEDAGYPRAEITVLQCTTEYPTPAEDVNLLAMVTIRDQLGVRAGYSDHTEGPLATLAAVALGAEVIEKHFTLDRTMEGPDHRASMEPDALASLVASIRTLEVMLGDGQKRPHRTELDNAAVARKSIVAARDIAAGERLTEADLAVKRPGTGLSPMLWDEVVGSIARQAYREDEQIGASAIDTVGKE